MQSKSYLLELKYLLKLRFFPEVFFVQLLGGYTNFSNQFVFKILHDNTKTA